MRDRCLKDRQTLRQTDVLKLHVMIKGLYNVPVLDTNVVKLWYSSLIETIYKIILPCFIFA